MAKVLLYTDKDKRLIYLLDHQTIYKLDYSQDEWSVYIGDVKFKSKTNLITPRQFLFLSSYKDITALAPVIGLSDNVFRVYLDTTYTGMRLCIVFKISSAEKQLYSNEISNYTESFPVDFIDMTSSTYIGEDINDIILEAVTLSLSI